MRFLPIVDRELRGGSRRRGTYWLRVRVAFQALLVGLAAYAVNLLQPQVALGTVLFWGLSGISLLFCLLAGRRSTADCLSQEKRDGTLGLLFLTDLKGYDVVLGKLAASSISGFYALVAIFPVLAIPLLAGGMTNGELWRMALVLVNTFFLSVAVGVFASAVCREYRAAMAMNSFVALLLMAVPAAYGLALLSLPRHGFVPPWFYSCPVFSFIYCQDGFYTKWPADFWWSLAVTHGLAWGLTLLACWIVPRTWADRPAPAPSTGWGWRDLNRMTSYGSQAQCAGFRKQALDVNPFYWLAGRARLKPAQVWFFLGVSVVWWIQGWLRTRPYWVGEETFMVAGFIINSTLKLWMANEAGQRLSEDRRCGAFELLLATPLTVGDILRGQILALRRQFLKPLLLVTGLELALALALARQWPLKALDSSICVAGVGMLWADVVALAWVAMAAALTCKSQTQAAAFTVARILVLPWVLFGTILITINLLDWLDLARWRPSEQSGLGLWFGLGVAADLFFGLRAWRLLRNHFRRLAVQSFLREPARSRWWIFLRTAAGWAARMAGQIPARARKPVFACLAAGLALAVFLMVRPGHAHYPPPVFVSITQSNAPFQVFPGGGGGTFSGVFFIMPDGALWQWGKPGAPQSPRSVVPERVGAGQDWVKVVGAGTHCLGLRADGTIWGWGFGNGRFWGVPQPASDGHDWVDIGAGQRHAAAVKSDGTLWFWNEPLVGFRNHPPPKTRGPGATWAAVYCGNDSTLALRQDGTLWAGGNISGFVGWTTRMLHTNVSFPTRLCAESNWSALDVNGLARNQAGELWDVASALPTPQAGAAAVCSLVSSNWALDRVRSVPAWTRAQVRADGTLWTARRVPWPEAGAGVENWRRLDSRTDWVAVWGCGLTGFGLTADGTVWTWGARLDKEPVKTYESRLQLLRARLTGGSSAAGRMTFSESAQPRPLLKLAGGEPVPPRK